MNDLVNYQPNKRALAEAKTVPEIKAVRGMAAAVEKWAKDAKDTDLLYQAVEMRIRAEIKAGEVLIAMAERGERPLGRKKESHRETLSSLGINKTQSHRWQQLALLPPSDQEKKILHAQRKAESAISGLVRGTTATGDNGWNTPSEYVELAREVLGEIDLDPASNDNAQKTIKAKQYFTKKDKGEFQTWCGRVWLNPPYAQPLIVHFIDKLIDEFLDGGVTEAILLTHNCSDTHWFQKALGYSSAFCHVKGRIPFEHADDGFIAAPTFGQTFFYFGDRSHRFAEIFDEIGYIGAAFQPAPASALPVHKAPSLLDFVPPTERKRVSAR